MTDCFQVVPPGLLNTLVGRDGGVPGRASEVLSVLVRNVLSLRGFEALGEAKVDDVDAVLGSVGAANQEIVRLDVSVDDSLVVHFLNSLQHLDSNHQHSLQVELPLAGLEQVLDGRPEQVHDHHMEVLVGDRTVGADVV